MTTRSLAPVIPADVMASAWEDLWSELLDPTADEATADEAQPEPAPTGPHVQSAKRGTAETARAGISSSDEEHKAYYYEPDGEAAILADLDDWAAEVEAGEEAGGHGIA